MTQTIRVNDASVEKAIQKGLRQLQLTQDDVEIEVIDEGKKGLFGFGQKDAVVSITVKEKIEQEEVIEEVEESYEEEFDLEDNYTESDESVEVLDNHIEEAAHVTKAYLEQIAEIYGAPSVVHVEVQKEKMNFVFETEKPGLLIGKYGKILNALQVLAQVSVHRFVKGRMSVQVDVGDYRLRRTEALQQIAERTARRVLKTKQPVYLEPLPAYERKQIHAYLSKNKRISTHSEGKEPHRYLVVEIAD
ncbi:RNA-binding cell elongation regulator Jag/EloR [uncultured Granulicatella sp.]|uniref:RNA-binding cell elongation regulator Jag/EloR n=1 Tax=uncultured Granulicatella sp. TaxID=316089 RepID=UPI0028D35751|nr:RNA-binding cell elongation regulator Jag/EloR [uncultured Granulicatella sp.]